MLKKRDFCGLHVEFILIYFHIFWSCVCVCFALKPSTLTPTQEPSMEPTVQPTPRPTTPKPSLVTSDIPASTMPPPTMPPSTLPASTSFGSTMPASPTLTPGHFTPSPTPTAAYADRNGDSLVPTPSGELYFTLVTYFLEY